MRYLITSDLHLGSEYSRVGLFKTMVERLQPSVCLVLAGDTIDAPGRPLSQDAEAALQVIRDRANSNSVIWIEGNHDDGYYPPDTNTIQFSLEYAIGSRLCIIHGDTFDGVMPKNKWFVRSFKFFHKLRLRLGADPIHVADYAKKFGGLYRFLCRKVMVCAVDHARQGGFDAIVCGHVHFAEDTFHEGLRYINLGAWTESPCFCLLVDDESIRLIAVEEAMLDDHWFELTALKPGV